MDLSLADAFGGWGSKRSWKRGFTDSVEEDVSSVFDVDEDSDLLGEALMAKHDETVGKG